jgi:hypothetical protein
MNRTIVPAVILSALAVHCSKKDDAVQLAPSASSLAASSADVSAMAWHFKVDPASKAHVDMPGVSEHIMGDTTAAAGTVDIVAHDLSKSRGLVRIDLSTFSTHTFNVADKDAAQTGHARAWMEVLVDGKPNEDTRWADFAIRSVDGLSATDVTKVPATKDGSDDVRTVTATVHGDLLIHGHKVQKDDVVDVTFRYSSGAAADAKPTRVEIKSKKPMTVVLKEHDVRPRDPGGKLLEWTTQLVSKVAESADVTVEVGATPTADATGTSGK